MLTVRPGNRRTLRPRGASARICASRVVLRPSGASRPSRLLGIGPVVGLVVLLGLAFGPGLGPAVAADPSASPPSPAPSVARANPNALLFLGNPNIAPVLFRSETGNDGLAADIVGAMAQHMSQPVELQLMDWNRAQAIVAAGGADVLVQINRTPQREKLFDFSSPLLESHFSIFVRSDETGLATLPSLAGHRVGVEAGGLPAQLLASSAPAAIAVTVPDFTTAFGQLVKHELDAVIVDYRVGSFALARSRITDVRATGDAIAPSWSAFAVRKGNTALLDELNAALGVIRADGTYDRIVAAWAPTEGIFETEGEVASRQLIALVGVLAVLLTGSLLWAMFSWRQVRRARRAELALDEAQRVAQVGSWSLDRRSGRSAVSAELRRIAGDATGDVGAGRHPAIGDDPEEAAVRDAAVAHTLATGEPYELEFDLQRPDGSVRHLLSRGEAVRGADGTISGVRGTVADVTELRDAQARADQAQRAQLVGRLAGGVAHDFNNLLASISGYVEFVEDGIDAGDPLRDDIAGIRDAADRAASLTRQLLAYGRQQNLRPTTFDAGEMLLGLRPLLRSLCGETVTLEISSEQDRTRVLADRATLEQAVVNLVLNARDAMPEGGAVRIAARRVELDADAAVLHPPVVPGWYVEVSVADVGTGIAPQVLAHIFEPFFSTKDVSAGSGLGLASVEGAISQSHGHIGVASEAGHGSVFTIYLPLAGAPDADAAVSPSAVASAAALAPAAAAHAAATPAPAAATPAGAGAPIAAGATSSPSAPPRTVLVVEDDAVVRMLVRRILERLGYDVVDAPNPEVALAIMVARASAFDLVLTDVLMPGMNGQEMVERMRQLRPDLPAVFMSGYSPDAVLSGEDLPANTAFLAKPFTAEALGGQIASVLSGQRELAGA